MSRKRTVRIPLTDASGPRVGYKELSNGNFEIGVIRGSQLFVYELPAEVWEKVKKQGYLDLEQTR